MRLGLESLEDRRALAAYTTQVLDPNNLVPADVEGRILANLDFAMRNVSNFVDWKGTLDAKVYIAPNRPDFPDGILTAVTSTMPGNRNAAIYEMTTGIDPYPKDPDCGATLWVAKDGSLKIRGFGLYYDPAPASYVPSDVPSGTIDFVGALTHEIFHGIGIRDTVEFGRYLTTIKGNTYFAGPNTVAALGQPLPYIGGGHYGNTSLPDNPIGTGLMFQWANIEKNRLDIGKLDLAILKDLGLTVKNTEGLPLVDRIDSQMPRTVLSVSSVDENLAPGSSVGMVLAQAGTGFSFSLPEGLRDNRSFRIVGNTLVTAEQIDYEKKNSYTIEVRNVDPSGVWTHTVIALGVRDLDDTPRIVAPSRVSMNNGALSLGCVNLTGDSSQVVSMAIFSRRGVITSTIRDPAVKVYIVRNTSGGTTAFLVGSILAINRNTSSLSYSGDDSKLVVDIAATIGGVAKNYGKWEIELVRSQILPPPPVLLPGRLPILRV